MLHMLDVTHEYMVRERMHTIASMNRAHTQVHTHHWTMLVFSAVVRMPERDRLQ